MSSEDSASNGATDQIDQLLTGVNGEATDNSWTNWARVLLAQVVVYAAQNPWSFLYTVFLCLSPFFLLSAICAYKLAKEIEVKDREKKKKDRREANVARARRVKKTD